MDTLLCNNDGDIVIGTYQPSNTLLSLSADQYTAGSATWSDQSGNGLNFTVSTNAALKGTDADGFPYMNFSGSYGIAKRIVSSALTNITAPTTGKYTIFCVTQMLGTTIGRTLLRGSGADHQVYVNNNTNNLGLYDNSGSNFVDSGFDITTAMANSRNLLVWELSTTAPIYKFQLNESGTNSTINSATNYTLPFCCIGGYHNVSTVITTSSQYWGNIYEFIVYDGVLSASERAYVAEYLAYKWAITQKLPTFTSTQGVIGLNNIVTRNLAVVLDASSYSGTGTTWSDISGNGRNATIRGAVSWVNGGNTSYFNFPGANADYINQTAGTTQIYKDMCIVFQHEDSDFNYLLASSTTSDRSLRIYGNTVSNPGNTGDWAQSATTYYVNGVADTNAVALSQNQWYILGGENKNASLLASAWNYYIGTGYTQGSRNLNGKIAFLALYTAPLTATEHIENYNALKRRFGI